MTSCSSCGQETNSETNPMLIGQSNGILVHVRFSVASFARRAGDSAWLTGSGVDVLISGGIVEVV